MTFYLCHHQEVSQVDIEYFIACRLFCHDEAGITIRQKTQDVYKRQLQSSQR